MSVNKVLSTDLIKGIDYAFRDLKKSVKGSEVKAIIQDKSKKLKEVIEKANNSKISLLAKIVKETGAPVVDGRIVWHDMQKMSDELKRMSFLYNDLFWAIKAKQDYLKKLEVLNNLFVDNKTYELTFEQLGELSNDIDDNFIPAGVDLAENKSN